MEQCDGEVLHHVRVLDVVVEGPVVSVDLYGGPSHVCGNLRFSCPDPVQRSDHVLTLWRWRREQVPLTLLWAGDEARLVDEEGLLAEALEGADAWPAAD